MPRLRLPIALIVAFSMACALALTTAAGVRAQGEPPGARILFLTGRYTEAREAYARLAKQDSVASAIGVARCQAAVGKLDEAIETLRAAAEKHPGAAAPRAELAQLEFDRGQHEAARQWVDAALARDPDQPAARFVDAELHRVAGRLDEANIAYRWFVRLYNRDQDKIEDPEVLRWIGLAAAHYARWNRNSGQFHFLVNDLYPDALKRDPNYWPAHLEEALLFIEKYNRSDAMAELDSAMAINRNSAEVHAARALVALQGFALDSARAAIDRSLAINPRLKVAHRLSADVQMVASGPREALPILERARALDPTDEETLGRLAAVYGAIDGLKDDPGTRMGAVIAEATKRNEHCGAFFAALAASLDLLGRYPYVARYYEEARRRMPQLIATPGQLGLVYMRLGDETQAREMLKEAFEIDPFNVRVKNSLEVLDVLADYGTIETDHFVTRFDRTRDSLLARYAARYLEDEVYPDIVKKLGYQPPGKSLFEIFSRAKGTSGHGWFSARTVGLPFIGTVGACAGKIVAVTSPNDGETRFNWARVLKHEFVHIVNLQQTDFTISRWFTEALAVRNQGPERPQSWDQVLARRAAADSLFNLDTINLGFVRPSSGEDWTLAYVQAELYARYMADTYGADALNKMVAAYGDNLDTRSALKRSFGVTQEAFEKGYRRYIDGIVSGPGFRGSRELRRPESLATLERAAEKQPKDAGLLARLGRAYLDEGRMSRARETAGKALEIDPKQQLAAFVVARVHLSERAKPKAMEVLRAAVDTVAPDPEALALLVDLLLEAKDYAEAGRLASIGEERFPLAANWKQGLASVYREAGDRDKLAAVLTRLAERDVDAFGPRTELAQLAIDRKDFEAAARWAEEALQIDVTNPDAHATLAQALAERGRSEKSIEEYDVAIALQPEKLEWRLALAKVCATAGRKDRARRVLTELMGRDAKYPGARELLDTLGR